MKKIVLLFSLFLFLSINIFSQAIPKQISFQGILKDAAGALLSGEYTLTFNIYNEPSGGSALWTESQLTAVSNGVFTVQLGNTIPIEGVPFDRMHFLGIAINSESELVPRTLLSPTPYSFMAVNIMDNSVTTAKIEDGAITAVKIGSNQVVKSLNGVKDNVNLVAGSNITLTPSGNNITIDAAGGAGIGGTGTTNYLPRFTAENTLGNSNIFQNGTNTGIGTITPIYTLAVLDNSTVEYAASVVKNTTVTSRSLLVEKTGEGAGTAMYGINNGTTGSGTFGRSQNYHGLWGETGRTDNNYGIYTPDNLFSLNVNISGAIMQVARNAGTEVLEAGDVVAIAGIEQDSKGNQTIKIQKSTSEKISSVIGVVYSSFPEQLLPGNSSPDGTVIPESSPLVQPNGYLLIVTQGPAKIKTDASVKTLQPGDLLSVSDQPGYAGSARQTEIQGVKIPIPGTVLGKLLSPEDPSNNEFSTVYVNLK